MKSNYGFFAVRTNAEITRRYALVVNRPPVLRFVVISEFS